MKLTLILLAIVIATLMALSLIGVQTGVYQLDLAVDVLLETAGLA
jgi:hypothetical protein